MELFFFVFLALLTAGSLFFRYIFWEEVYNRTLTQHAYLLMVLLIPVVILIWQWRIEKNGAIVTQERGSCQLMSTMQISNYSVTHTGCFVRREMHWACLLAFGEKHTESTHSSFQISLQQIWKLKCLKIIFYKQTSEETRKIHSTFYKFVDWSKNTKFVWPVKHGIH